MKSIAILGATGGLGVSISKALAKRAPVCIGYWRGKDRAEELSTELKSNGYVAHALQVDVRDSASVQKFIGEAIRLTGGLEAIVSASGPVMPLRPMVEVNDEDFDRVYSTDVRGAFNVIKHGSLALKESGGGSIVWILTTASLRTLENDGMSAGPKTAVAALIKQVAREMGPFNVRCNGVALAAIDTGMVYAPEFAGDPVAQAVIASMIQNTPLGRMGLPAEVSSTIDFLVSPGAGYINGQIIGVDGGFSA